MESGRAVGFKVASPGNASAVEDSLWRARIRPSGLGLEPAAHVAF
jgi:hypothetical protein